MPEKYSEAIEDYLKIIYKLQQGGKVTTTGLAAQLNVAPASVTGMVKKLAGLALLLHEPYQGVQLTEAGEKVALKVIRHHRLVELFLAEKLGVPWDEVHAQADRWEHSLSKYLATRLDAMLGYPTTDPHGAPIPTPDGEIIAPETVRLTDIEPGETVTVTEVSDDDANVLRYFAELGLRPNVTITVINSIPLAESLALCIDGVHHEVGREVMQQVLVTRNSPEPFG
ncbi:MAG: metal-dependent transcriptional regulator [Anaerolineae bacterium]|nr:metal-dependent transcriptional regulator [Anaerolineae bacterium]